MMSDVQATLGPRERPYSTAVWRAPLLTLFLGLLITLAFGAERSSHAEAQSRERFEADAQRIGARLSVELAARITEFEVGVDYISSAPTIDPAGLERFLRRRQTVDAGLSEDVGFIVTETVQQNEMHKFVTDQRQERPGFAVFDPLSATDPERLIITHIERDIAVFGRTFVGFDLTAVQGSFVPTGARESQTIFAQVVPAQEFVLLDYGEPFQPPTDFESVVIYLTSSFSTSDASVTGFAAKVMSVDGLVAAISDAVGPELAIDARLPGSQRNAASIDRRTANDAARAELLRISGTTGSESVNLTPLEITLTASSRYDSHPQALLWFRGVGLSALTAAAFWWRARQSQRLSIAGLELAIATKLAATDPLTGLLNRQGLLDAISQQSAPEGSIVFVDLDRFKAINDADGHQRGDLVLMQFGDLLRSHVRQTDLVCRLGGDEFLVFIPGAADPERTQQLMCVIRGGLSRIDERLSCSIGVAQLCPHSGQTTTEAIAQADFLMYEDKKSRREQCH